jgi:hypothetical protein
MGREKYVSNFGAKQGGVFLALKKGVFGCHKKRDSKTRN